MRLLPLLAVTGYLRAYETQALKEAAGDLRSATLRACSAAMSFWSCS